MRVQAAPPAHFDWLVQRTGAALTPGARGVEAVDAHGRILGMLVFDAWTRSACTAHMAVDTPIAWRRLLPAGLDYAFHQAGKRLVLGVIPGHNPRSLAMARRIGFQVTHRARDGWDTGVDLVFLELRREDAHWLNAEKGGVR